MGLNTTLTVDTVMVDKVINAVAVEAKPKPRLLTDKYQRVSVSNNWKTGTATFELGFGKVITATEGMGTKDYSTSAVQYKFEAFERDGKTYPGLVKAKEFLKDRGFNTDKVKIYFNELTLVNGRIVMDENRSTHLYVR
jgi:hypothetical protein